MVAGGCGRDHDAMDQGDPVQRRTTEEMDTTMEQGAVPRDGVRRLVRRRQGKIIAGVAAGLADYFHVDPVLVRIAFVAAALAGGTGVIAYLAGWLLMPDAEEPGAPPRERGGLDRLQAWVGIALLVVGASMLFGRIGWWDSGVLWALALIGIGLALFLRERDQVSPPAAAPPPPPPYGGAIGV